MEVMSTLDVGWIYSGALCSLTATGPRRRTLRSTSSQGAYTYLQGLVSPDVPLLWCWLIDE